MPGVSRNQRAEAKYNVTLDFPHLGLHSAASSGNLGLVTYALDHGQPVNSVVDGVLPLHVASSGGNDIIVRLLIERGADVNAPRLPRKYSSDKYRDTTAPIVGTSGSTPLHFAAANGHERVVLTLLLHGAHPDRPDKHGVSPEIVARQNGWTRCAEIISKWTHEKDRDLREREAVSGSVSVSAPEADNASVYSRQDIESRIRQHGLKVKSSIDNAINNMLRPFPTPPSSGTLPPDAMYSAPPPTITGSASLESSPSASTEHESSHKQDRRPSLPQIFDVPPNSAHNHSMSTSQTQSAAHHHPKSSGRPSFSCPRRPRSAGTDADTSIASLSSTPGRVRGKLSLLSMFKKSTGESPSSASTPGSGGGGGPSTPESRDSFTGASNASASASSSSAVTSGSVSPAPESEQPRERSRGPSPHVPLGTRTSGAEPTGSLSSVSPPALSTVSPPTLSTVPSNRSRTSESETAYPPLAVELHRKLSAERLRSRSGSGSSTQNPATPADRPLTQSPSPQPPPLPPSQAQGSLPSHRSPLMRPGILRPHGRSASSGQSTLPLPEGRMGEGSARSLRFDSTMRSGLNLDLNGSESISSLRDDQSTRRSPRSTASQTRLRERERDPSVDAMNRHHRNCTVMDDEDDEGYGEVISPRIGLGLALQGEGKSRLNELRSTERQVQRQPSMNSQLSRESSTGSPLPSPILPPESGFDCPFSINRPPPQPLSYDATISSPPSQSQPSQSSESRSNLLGIHGVDNRARGDSFGSMSTMTDTSMPLTPGPGPTLGLEIRSPDAGSFDLPSDDYVLGGRTRTDSSASRTNYLLERERQHSVRARTMSPPRSRALPLDIDIRAISSHAQAEALVQRAQKSILDMEDVDIELPGLGLGSVGSTGSTGLGGLGGGGALPSGRTPLSAKLAAYGESLAIERRFKEKEARERRIVRDVSPGPWISARSRSGSGNGNGATPVGSPTTPRDIDRLRTMCSESGFRKFSLDGRPVRGPTLAPAPRRTKPKRPHTSDGETSDSTTAFLSPEKPLSSGHHKSSLSGSALVGSRPPQSPERDTHLRPPASAHTLPLISSPCSLDGGSPPRIVRSRTPEPEGPYLDSPSASGGPFGVPLSRIATAPPRHASPDIIAERTLSEQDRERARANKLMKMGLLAHDSFPRTNSPYGHGHARNGGGGGGSGAGVGVGASGKQRFGGIRGFVQTLTGKS